MSDKLPSSGRLRTREQQKAAKKKGDIRGFFSLPRGRPPKQTKEQAPKRKEEKEVQPAVDLPEDWKPAAKKKIRSSYLNYANTTLLVSTSVRRALAQLVTNAVYNHPLISIFPSVWISIVTLIPRESICSWGQSWNPQVEARQ